MSNVTPLTIPRQLVVFRVGATHYGLEIDAVDEILPVLPVTATPGAQPGVLGLADVRKRVVPVYDLHWKFNVEKPAQNPDARFILVELGDDAVALLVDEVEEVLNVSREDFQEVSTPGSGARVDYLRGVFRHDSHLTLWVDQARLVPKAVLAAA